MRGGPDTRTERRWHRVGVTLLAMVLVGAMLSPGVYAEEDGEEVRTDAGGLGGYTAQSTASPVSVLFFEPVFPIPVDPGEPHFETTFQMSKTQLATGPRGRALASSAWPGHGIGDGFPELADGEEWPFKADARYPDGPLDDAQETPWGAGMSASAHGLDMFARASTAESPDDEVFDVGAVRSRALSTVEDGVVRSRSVATVRDVSLLGGLVEIGEVSTVIEARSDAEHGETEGHTTVSELTIAGYGFVIDEDGLRPVEEGERGDGLIGLPDAMPGAEEMREMLGIEVHLADPEDETEGADARRRAQGVRVVFDNTVLRSALDEHVDLFELIDLLPDELAVELYPLLQVSPRMEFILGRGEVRAAASAALEFDFELDVDDVPPPIDGAPPPEPTDGFAAPTVEQPASAPAAEPTEDEPVVADAPEEPIALGREMPEFFAGIPPAVAALGFLLVALGTYALTGLSGVAMAGGAAGCDRGATRRVPDLRRG